MPNMEDELKMTCSRGRWIFGDYITLPYEKFCTPICKIPCQNGGECTAADICTCPPKYTGKYCQKFIENPCLEIPSPLPNSVITLQ